MTAATPTNNPDLEAPVFEVPEMLSSAAASLETLGRNREAKAAAAAAAPRDRVEPTRRRRTNLGSPQLKLTVFNTDLPGFHLYWANDSDNQIQALLAEGFEYVTPAEVSMGRAVDPTAEGGDILNRVSKGVDTTKDGKPVRAYLMKCPLDLWEEIQENVNDLADSRDRDILESAKRGGERYQPDGYQTKITSGSRR